MDDFLLQASRAALAIVGVGGSFAVVLAALARPRGHRGWPAVVATCLILLAFGAGILASWGVDDAVVEVIQTSWFVAFPLLAATFPDGRFVPRWSMWVVVAYAALMAVDAATGGAFRDQAWWGAIAATQMAVLGFTVYRYRRSATTEERESVRWVILGVLVTAACFGIIQLTDGVIGGPGALSAAKATLAGLPLSAGLVIGMVRPRLWNVDAAFRMFLAVASSAILLGTTFWLVSNGAVTGGASALDAGRWGALAVGIAAYPVIRLGLLLGDWTVYRGRPDEAAAARRLAVALDEAEGPYAVADTVTQTVAGAVGSTAVALSAGHAADSGLFDRGTAPDAAEDFAIEFRGERLAVLHVAPRSGESALTRRDRSTVRALLGHAAPALHGARALVEAIDAQARLVTAREEERRHLRADLHDDLTPTLAGLALSAAALARRASGDAAIAATADDLHAGIQSAVEQTRLISHGLRPPVLDDHGLLAALRVRVVEPMRGELDVEVDATELGPLPAAVELAALRIVQESVENARRHSGAGRCRVRLERAAHDLLIEVVDQGVGLPVPVRPGVGIRSIRARAEELGGTAEFGPPRSAMTLGGARVFVRLPLVLPTPRPSELAS